MAPIRVGLIGLSATMIPKMPGSWAGATHLPPLLASPAFDLVAVTGSSPEAARRSLAAHGLSESRVKVHDDAESLAADPGVDLVVVSVRVENHGKLARPALEHGKDVFVEWPLGKSTAEAAELTALAREKGVRTMVGLQARADRLAKKVKEVVAEGKIGRLTSSTVLASSSPVPSSAWIQGVEYYLDLKSGGNEFHIFFGHCRFPSDLGIRRVLTWVTVLDSFVDVLGDFDTLQATLKTQFATISIFNDKGELIEAAHPKTSPDQILVQGVLTSGAVASIAFRKPQDPVDDVGIRWLITGTDGEIEVTVPPGHWQMSPPGAKLRLKVGKGPAQEVDYWGDSGADKKEWDHYVINVAAEYEAFAEGDTERFATFESALKLHRLLDRILEAANAGN